MFALMLIRAKQKTQGLAHLPSKQKVSSTNTGGVV